MKSAPPAAVVRVHALDPANAREVDGVCDVHSQLLPDSVVVLFGRPFMRFFYGTLVRAGLLAVTVARTDERVVGFISYTREPTGFMRRAVREHFIAMAWSVLRSVLRDPRTVRQLLLALRLMKGGTDDAGGPQPQRTGEILTLAAIREFETAVPEGGRSRLTIRLVEEMARYFQAEGFPAAWFYVLPHNIASNLFCSSLGCEFAKTRKAGVVVHRYTFHPGEWLSARGHTA